jgi:Zn finger protein HypA/HybF involved in hydrogenase expression
MATTSPVGRSIQQAAIDRLRRHLTRHDDQRVFTLVEVAEATAMDPNTVESAMDLLAAADGTEGTDLHVARQNSEYGELQWTVRRNG